MISENCDTGLNVCVGPYTIIGDKVKIINSEIENSIVIEETRIDCYKKIAHRLIRKNIEVVDSSPVYRKDTNSLQGVHQR
jgi:NDP-sugar pyrophosphorylase family protein